ncbi:MAG: restriction endonuclease, partial [Desulfuromonas sp.]
MRDRHKKLSDAEQNNLIEKMRAEQRQRESGYREQALKLFPWV